VTIGTGGEDVNAIRIGVSLPLVVLSSIFLEKYFKKDEYKLPKAAA